MGYPHDVKTVRHKQVCVLKVGMMHVLHLINVFSFLFFVINVLSLDKLGDLRKYLTLCVIHRSKLNSHIHVTLQVSELASCFPIRQ